MTGLSLGAPFSAMLKATKALKCRCSDVTPVRSTKGLVAASFYLLWQLDPFLFDLSDQLPKDMSNMYKPLSERKNMFDTFGLTQTAKLA